MNVNCPTEGGHAAMFSNVGISVNLSVGCCVRYGVLVNPVIGHTVSWAGSGDPVGCDACPCPWPGVDGLTGGDGRRTDWAMAVSVVFRVLTLVGNAPCDGPEEPLLQGIELIVLRLMKFVSLVGPASSGVDDFGLSRLG